MPLLAATEIDAYLERLMAHAEAQPWMTSEVADDREPLCFWCEEIGDLVDATTACGDCGEALCPKHVHDGLCADCWGRAYGDPGDGACQDCGKPSQGEVYCGGCQARRDALVANFAGMRS
ncbi:MAG: hypothetical protein M0Z36_06620 [Thermaerobacter sp.]|nr:hypothetical protein [Thermaerobacter sp.]